MYFVLLKCLVVNVTLLGCARLCVWEHIQLCKIYKFMIIALPLNFLLVLWEFCTMNFGHIPFPLSTPPTSTPLLYSPTHLTWFPFYPLYHPWNAICNACMFWICDLPWSMASLPVTILLKKTDSLFPVPINCLLVAPWLGEGLCAFPLQAGIWSGLRLHGSYDATMESCYNMYSHLKFNL